MDPEALTDVPHDGDSGVLLCRGPQVMRSTLGYEDNAEANARAFPLGNEWFHTGDLGFICPGKVPGSRMAEMVVLTGRAKARTFTSHDFELRAVVALLSHLVEDVHPRSCNFLSSSSATVS